MGIKEECSVVFHSLPHRQIEILIKVELRFALRPNNFFNLISKLDKKGKKREQAKEEELIFSIQFVTF